MEILVHNEFSNYFMVSWGYFEKKKNLTLDVSISYPLLQISFSKNKPYDV